MPPRGVAWRATPRYSTRGRPSQGAQLPRSSTLSRGARLLHRGPTAPVDQQRGFILATHELDETLLPPQELLTA